MKIGIAHGIPSIVVAVEECEILFRLKSESEERKDGRMVTGTHTLGLNQKRLYAAAFSCSAEGV
jgi:hypothetical protein